MRLVEAFRYTQPRTLAFVGAGGKSTALYRVARELLSTSTAEAHPGTVFVTTSTHFGAWQAGLADHLVWVKSKADIDRLERELPHGCVLLVREGKADRLSGLHTEELEAVHSLAKRNKLPLLIEADGAHMLPLKAPADGEPVIPGFTEQVVVVAGLTGLGKPLAEEWVHRPEVFACISGQQVGDKVSSQALAKVLRAQEGGLKNIPTEARKTLLLNQADSTELQSQGRVIAQQLIPDYHSIVIASLQGGEKVTGSEIRTLYQKGEAIQAVIEHIAGIVLAAGGSRRFGEPKQLLRWRGRPLIRHVVATALEAGLSPVIVVVGASAQEVEASLTDLSVRIVNNRYWKEGLSSSIRVGIENIPQFTGGAVFFQADHPQVPSTLVRRLVEAHEGTLAPIVAPQIDGQRGNPVLFDAITFNDLQSLRGEMGGRELFSKFPVDWVAWHDARLLLDIDTLEDYQKFLELYPDIEAMP